MSQLITLEYNGISVNFTGQAWFNATKVAEKFGRVPHDWLRLPDTLRYLEGLERRYGKIPYVKTSKARSDRGGGTWMHPRLGVAFARWLDTDFSIWCDEQVDLILRGGLAEWRRSSAEERVDMQIKALRAALKRKKAWSHVMGWGNRWAGVTRSRFMSVGQVRDTSGFYDRVGTFAETPEDLTRIESNSIALYGESPQLPLLGVSA